MQQRKYKKSKKKKDFEELLRKEWLKKNKITKCEDAYLDNPYKQKAGHRIEF